MILNIINFFLMIFFNLYKMENIEMSSKSLKSAWKEKIEPNNIFDEKFLNEKDIALQPIEFLFETEEEALSNKSINKNILTLDKKKEKKGRKSLKESDLYDSNIVIVQTASDYDSEDNKTKQFEKEIEKINKLIAKRVKNYKSKSKSKKKLNKKNI